MQITLKTLQQQTFRIDIDPEETVRALAGAGGGWRAAPRPLPGSGLAGPFPPERARPGPRRLGGKVGWAFSVAAGAGAEVGEGRTGRALGEGRAARAGGGVAGAFVRAGAVRG